MTPKEMIATFWLALSIIAFIKGSKNEPYYFLILSAVWAAAE
jgi:hypothetical protein